MSWSLSRTEALVDMWTVDKLSLGLIAVKLGKSRSAISGKLKRLGLFDGRDTEQRGKRKPSQTARGVNLLVFGAKVRGERSAVESTVIAADLEPTAFGVAGTLSLTSDQCRWLFGDTRLKRDTAWCARATADGSPYCPTHHARCYRGKGRR